MRALYPVIGAGAVDVCLRASEAAPLWIRAPWLRPHAFSCIWDQGVRVFLQCMCYIQVVGFTIRSGLLE